MVEAQSVVERPTKRKRDRSNLSKLARARKVQFPDTSFEDAPEIAANAGVRTDARLRDAAAMTHRGEDALSLRGDIVTGLGTTGRGLLGVTCDHYLPANRFAWWDVDKAGGVPDTGRIGDTADLRKTFCDEFCSSLATVVGADLDGPFRSSKAHKVPWDGLRSGSSPNNTPLIEFSVRSERPGSVPAIMTLPVLTHDDKDTPVDAKVLINAVEEGHTLDATQTRPSLFIHFVVPQRAVGLEFGFLGGPDRSLNKKHVKLIGYDRDGVKIFAASPFHRVQANDVDNLIGVRDKDGEISSVELRFEHPDYTILEPQIIYRIWHEPLPPAAIRQGTAETVWYGPYDDRNEETRVCESLPFHCDQYIRMVRGFRLEFLDDESYEVSSFDIRLEEVRHDRTCEDGQVELVARGGISANDAEGYTPHKLKIYYTLLAWDSDQMDVYSTSTSIGGLSYLRSFGKIVTEDPCSDPRREWAAPGENVCGEVFGAMDSFRCTVWNQQMEEMTFWMDPPRRIVGDLPRTSLVTPEPVGISLDVDGPSGSSGTSLVWTMESTIEAEQEGRSRWHMTGSLGTGSSVLRPLSTVLDFDPLSIAVSHHIRRQDREWYIKPEHVTRHNKEGTVAADMAFVSIEAIHLWDMDCVHALDVEIKGDSYDGSRVVWKAGIETEDYLAMVWPRFGGLVRRARKPRTALSKRDVFFDDATVGVISLVPDQFGFVRNDGNIPVIINEVTQGGEHAREFATRFEYRGDVLDVIELANRTPLRLDPGEKLTIGGRFFTNHGETDRSAWLEFRTNSEQTPYVLVDLLAPVVPSRAEAKWHPSQYSFGNVQTGDTETWTAAIQSFGETPLIVRSLGIQALPGTTMHPDSGFSFSGASPTNWHQVEPGQFLDVSITFSPTRQGQVEVDLVADTNAGQLKLRLMGAAY